MKTLLIILGVLVGIPLVAIIGLVIVGSIIGISSGGEEKMPTSPPANAPIAVVPTPVVAPDPDGLQSPDKDTRQIAASRMGETANPADCDALLAALPGETDWTVRAAIVTGLGKQYYQSSAVRAKGADRLLLPIIGELKSDQLGLRLSAMRALTTIRDKRAGRYLIPMLHDKDGDTREQAVTATGVLGSEENVPALIEILQTPSDGTVSGRFSPVRATTALANIGDKRAVEPLIAQLHNKDETFSSACATALGRLGDMRAAAPLRELLTSSSDEVRFDAVCAVGHLRDREALPQLNQIARTEHKEVHGQKMNEVAERAIHYIQTGRGKVDQYE